MKLLKKLTKLVSAVLASVAVFSAGFSVLAMGDGNAVLKTATKEYHISRQKDGSFIFFLKGKGKPKYSIAFDPCKDEYCFLSCSDNFVYASINNPATGALANRFVLNNCNGDFLCTADLLPDGRWELTHPKKLDGVSGSQRYFQYVQPPRSSRPDQPDTKAYIIGERDKQLAIIWSRGISQEDVNRILFLLASSII